MARSINKLTALDIAQKAEPGYYGDGGGLYLQVSPTGTKSWLFIYTIDGRQRQMGLGSLHDYSLREAREIATAQRKLRHEGRDPIIERDARKAAAKIASAKRVTFDECARLYIAAHKKEWKNPKHQQQWTNTLATYASPHIGSHLVSDIDTDAVMKCLTPIWEEKTETATRIRGRIERILGWATTRDYRGGLNPARWVDHLDHLLAAPNKIMKVKHHAALPYDRMAAFMRELEEQEGLSAIALRFTILCAVRTNETVGATWEEIDLDEGVWSIPGNRMKMELEHRVPLSMLAIEILKELKKTAISPYVFPQEKKSLSTGAMTAVIRRMNAKSGGPFWIDPKTKSEITVHGCRSSFRDWAAEISHHEGKICEKALAHLVGDETERAYQRGDLLEKRRLLMEDWATYCATERTNGKVVPIRSNAAA